MGVYGEAPPKIKRGTHVYIADFSYGREQVKQLAKTASKITILDHHHSAEVELTGLDQECENVEIVFDMERSGAGITWDYFHPNEPRPLLIDMVEHRDLWHMDVENVAEFAAFISTTPHNLQAWDEMAEMSPEAMLACGSRVKSFQRRQIKIAVKAQASMCELLCPDGSIVELPMAPSPPGLGSDLANELCLKYGTNMAGYWLERSSDFQYGLRSTAPEHDVAEIAARFGGGGHLQASGFNTKQAVHKRKTD